MTKRLSAISLLATLLVLVAPVVVPAAPPRPAATRTVVVVLAPYLRWEDVLSGDMPETRALADSGATGNMNVRSLLPDSGRPSTEAGALMLSAGTWARYDPSGTAPVEASGTPAVVFPGLAAQHRANAGEDADIRLGTLGQAVEDAGGWTAAIGNGDAQSSSRPAALVAMDAAGRVRFGDVSRATLSTAGSADLPPGTISDARRIHAVLAEVLRQNGGPRLIVIDPGDLARAHVADRSPEGLSRADRLSALAALDGLIGTLPNELPEDAVLVVAVPVAAEVEGEPSGFGPLIVSGDGWSGTLTSASTHRPGIVTNADLTATILGVLGVHQPPQVAGSSISPAPSPVQSEERMLGLARVDAFMRAVDAARPAVLDGFILASVLLVAACAGLVAVRVPWEPLLRGGQIALLAVLAVPVASLLMYAVVYLPQTPGFVTVLLLATAAVVWVVDAASHQPATGQRALAVLALLTGAVVIVDQWLGAPLSLDGLLGYSPLVGARFYGLGNEAAALMVGGAITGCAVVFDTYADRAWVRRARGWGFPALGAAAVVTAAAPALGANVGVAIWGTVAFALAWWGMRGRRVTLRTVAVVVLVIMAVIAVFAGFDLASGARTHLGRAIVSAQRGGLGGIWTLLARKAATNVRLSLQSGWTALGVVLLGALAYVRIRPRGMLGDLLIERPSFAAALTACLLAAGVSYFSEDSGLIVPVLLLLFPAVAVMYLMLGASAARRARETAGR
ncbi:MAG TPA: hypothetical protein VGK50_02135 [Coriobacteriia bacterium]